MNSFVNNETKEHIKNEVPNNIRGLNMIGAVDELRPLVSAFCDLRQDLINLLGGSRWSSAENRVATQAIAQEFLKANRDLTKGNLSQMKQDSQLISVELTLVEIFNPGEIIVENEIDKGDPPTVNIGLPEKHKKD